jgi:hypothetical protein
VYGGEFRVYENRVETGNSLQLRLTGGADVSPLGAVVRVETDGGTQIRFRNAETDYQSQDSRIVHFGLGGAERVDRVSVTWRDGRTRTLEGVRAGQRLTVSPAGVTDRQPVAPSSNATG